MKKIFKKAITVLGTGLLIGSTAGIAAAAAYPSPFTSNTAIVYGSGAAEADMLAATDIASNLDAASTGTGGTVTTTGEVVSLDSGSTRIWLNTSLNTANSIFTKNDLPTVLGDYTFSGNVDAKLTSTIKFGPGSAAGDDNKGKVIFSKQPKSSNDPVMGISLGSDEGTNYFYNASFTSPAIAFNHSDSEGETIKLFGRDFVISTATDGDNLVLFASAKEVDLRAGGSNPNPIETVVIDGASYTVELVSASDSAATVSVNGDSKEINEGSSKKISGIDIAVQRADENTALDQVSASILVGANKLTFTNGAKVKQGSDDDPVDGTNVFITGTDSGDPVGSLTELRVSYFRARSSDDAVVPGTEFLDPVFGSFKVDFAGLNSNLDDSTRETISIENSGDKGMSIAFTDSDANAGSFLFAYNASQQFFLGDDGNYTIHVREMENISENQFLVLGNEDYGHLLEVTQISNDTGTDATDDKITVRDVMSGTTTEATFSSEGTGKLNIDGKEYTITFRGDGDAGRVQFKYPTGDSDNANTLVAWPTIQTANGAKLALYYPITLDLGKFDNAFGNQNQIITLSLPDGDGYSDLTFTYLDLDSAQNGQGGNWSISGGDATAVIGNHSGAVVDAQYYVANATLGDITYYFEDLNTSGTIAAANLTRIGILRVAQSSGASVIGPVDQLHPGVLFWEEQDNSNEYKPLFVDLEQNPAGSSTDGVGVNDVFFASDSHWSATMASDSDIEKEVDWWGTLVTTDSSTSSQKTSIISYPDNQVYAQIFLGEASASTSGSAGVMTVMDTEVSTVAGKNLVVVGGSAINSVAAELLGGAYRGDAFTAQTGVAAGGFLIESFARSGSTALLVAGYNAEDTTKATTYLLNNGASVDTTIGNKYTGTSATEATLVVA